MEFVRFGGLSSVNQKGYKPSMPTFHCPPLRRGTYAFPLGCEVPYLLGGNKNNVSRGMARFVKDRMGNRISTDDNDELYVNKEARPFVAGSGTV